MESFSSITKFVLCMDFVPHTFKMRFCKTIWWWNLWLVIRKVVYVYRYILHMHSHSDVEERDLGPPMTPPPFYTASNPTLLPL